MHLFYKPISKYGIDRNTSGQSLLISYFKSYDNYLKMAFIKYVYIYIYMFDRIIIMTMEMQLHFLQFVDDDLLTLYILKVACFKPLVPSVVNIRRLTKILISI